MLPRRAIWVGTRGSSELFCLHSLAKIDGRTEGSGMPANRAEDKRARGQIAFGMYMPGELMVAAKAAAAERGMSFRGWLIEAIAAAIAAHKKAKEK